MAIPTYDKYYDMILDILSDNEVHSKKDLIMNAAQTFNLTDNEINALLPSGNTTVLSDRIGWAITYLKKAGLISAPQKGHYQITERGRNAHSEMPTGISNTYLSQFQSFQDFTSNRRKSSEIIERLPVSDSEQTPEEAINDAIEQLDAKVADDLMDKIMASTPAFFERLVIDLLEAMGYGGKLEHPGIVTKYSGDEGIDGIIQEDALGFENIYVQAKRWKPSYKVGRPDIEKFAGALIGKKANKGLFITTSDFTKEARDYVDKAMTSKIVLINGIQLTNLMVQYNLGVSIERKLAIKKIDLDYFDTDEYE